MPHHYAVDLDGVLAEHEDWHGVTVIGRPIPAMLRRVKKWLAEGNDVTIFTARAGEGRKAINLIKVWLRNQGLPDLPVTHIKEHYFEKIYDDKAVTVEQNTGRILSIGE